MFAVQKKMPITAKLQSAKSRYLCTAFGATRLQKTLTALLNAEPKELVVTEPEYFEAFDIIVSPTHFDLLKSWMIVHQSLRYTGYLSEELRQLGGAYNRYLSGVDEAMPKEKAAYYLTIGQFSQVVGDYYGRKYFGEKQK